KERQLIPRQEVSAEPETNHDEQQHRAAHPGNLAWLVISAQKKNAEHVNEQRCDHQIGRPTVNRANQPAELNFSDDELNTFESIFGAWAIVKQEENSGGDLYDEEKQRHAAEVVPNRMAMERNFLFVGQLRQRADRQTLVEPICQVFDSQDRISTT